MRAQKEGKHISGAERLVSKEEIEETVRELLRRPKEYDFMSIKVERVNDVREIPFSLKISSYEFESVKKARDFAVKKLTEEGIKENLAKKAVEILARGANPSGGNMRGAVLMDVETGERLEPDKSRGIRTVNFDWKNRRKITEILLKGGYTLRTVDALALTMKNLYCGVIAELCWSDDPNYTIGYVSGKKIGYVRINPLKREGDPLGGRVYFVKKEKLSELIECLEKKAILIDWGDDF